MRLGLMIPAVNTVAEEEFHAGVPEGVSVHTARLFPEGPSIEELRAMVDDGVPRACDELRLVRPDVVVFACTAAGALVGKDGERALAEQIGARTSAPVVSMNAAVHEALLATRADAVAVLTPYPDEVNVRVVSSLEEAGFSIAICAGMGIEDDFHFSTITPDEIMAFAEKHLEGVRYGAILLSCGNVRTTRARSELSKRFEVPVLTSNKAALDQALAVLSAVAPA